MKDYAVEIARFRLKPGISESAFLKAASESDEALKTMPGFIRREISRNAEEGNWTDYCLWRTMEDAQAANASFHHHPKAQAFCEMIDMSHASMTHLNLVHEAA